MVAAPRILQCLTAQGQTGEGESAVKVSPYYSISEEEREVYHDHSNCPDGERILPRNKRPGMDNRPRCKECKKLD